MKTHSTSWLRRAALWLSTPVNLFAPVGLLTAAAVSQQPNIVIILTDDQGFADISPQPAPRGRGLDPAHGCAGR